MVSGLPVVVVDHALEQRLRRALGDPAVLLTRDQDRIQDASTVVDRDVAHEVDPSRLEVHVDHRDVRAERIGRLALVEVEGHSEAGLHVGRSTCLIVGGPRQLGPPHRHGGHAGDREGPVDQRHVGFVGFEQVGRELPGLADHGLARSVERAPGDLQRAGADGPSPSWYECRVRLHEAHGVEANAEQLRHDHRERGFVTLTVRRGSRPWRSRCRRRAPRPIRTPGTSPRRSPRRRWRRRCPAARCRRARVEPPAPGAARRTRRRAVPRRARRRSRRRRSSRR